MLKGRKRSADAAPSQPTKGNVVELPIVSQGVALTPEPAQPTSWFQKVVEYFTDSWSNKRWEANLEQQAKDLDARQLNFDRNAVALVASKADLSVRKSKLEARFAELKKMEAALRCAKDALRVDRDVLFEKTVEEAKRSAEVACQLLRDATGNELQSLTIQIDQSRAEIATLKKRIAELREILNKTANMLSAAVEEKSSEKVQTVAWGASLFAAEGSQSPIEIESSRNSSRLLL